ncbi:hypothetical protein AcV5_006402 [Taiwanofungus camphoratus]|nr:hypothetical protein AcV5_006402 [Antrodia cinnamomea]
MPTIVPTIEQIEEYLESIEEIVIASLNAATPDLPRVSEAIRRLWEDVSRFGPQSLSLPDIQFPGLGAFEVPPPPPPPPPPRSLWAQAADWVSEHPWTAAGISVGVGAGLLVGYRSFHLKHNARSRRVRATASMERRQVVVVLGGDMSSGLPLILELEKKGYIIITSVSTPEAVDEVERKCHGYVRALVLDPAEPDTIPYFLRSLSSTMSRRFPITSAGDPHAPPSTHLHIHSIITLLTLPSLSSTPSPGPLEHLPLRDTYSSYLQATHILPLLVLQALMPLLRTSPARARDALSNNLGKKSIIVCLPVTDARVGVPFASAQAMSAAATLRGVEVLRREIHMAALTDTSGSMKDIKVVVVDVGAVGGPDPVRDEHSLDDVQSSMDDWTLSEKVAYGTAFTFAVEQGLQYGVYRKPADVAVFVDTLIDIVSNGKKSTGSTNVLLRLGFGRLREWLRGDRVLVGAGGIVSYYYRHSSGLRSSFV